ncbi:MAG: MAPEG family protein [Candidatus Nitrosoglobus sp.]|jgi:uncharacterized MAPEG superfamily protein
MKSYKGYQNPRRVPTLCWIAILVLTAHTANVSNSATAIACVVYFWSRVVHLITYTFSVPWVRTLAFVAGFLSQATLASQLLTS